MPNQPRALARRETAGLAERDDTVEADAVETGNEQASRMELNVDPVGVGDAGCPPARQRVRLQRFGRHGRYAWSAGRRPQGVLQQVSAELTNGDNPGRPGTPSE